MAALGCTEGAQAEPLEAQDCMVELPLAGTWASGNPTSRSWLTGYFDL